MRTVNWFRSFRVHAKHINTGNHASGPMRLAAAARFVAHLESVQRGRPRNDGDGTVGLTQQVIDPKKFLQGSHQPQNEHQVVNSEDHRGQAEPWQTMTRGLLNSHILSSTKKSSWEQSVLRSVENKKLAETYCPEGCPFCGNTTMNAKVRDTFVFCLESDHISSLMNFNHFC